MAFFQTKHLWINQLADGVADLVLDRHDSSINFLDPTMLDDVGRALDAVAQSGQYRLLVIRSSKSESFCHGLPSDLIGAWTPAEFAAWAERAQAVAAKLVEARMPSVAVIAGSCFDAGLELALACDYRVVIDKPATSLGFPELEWGLVPCAGSTQRLPHLIGLEHTLHMLLGGVRHDARAAWLCGLADHLSEETDVDPPFFLADPHKRDWSVFPARTWREKYLESNRLGRWFLFRGAERILRTRIPSEMPAPIEMLAAVRLVHQHATIQLGLDFERQALRRVVEHPALHHLLRLMHRREVLRTVGAPRPREEGLLPFSRPPLREELGVRAHRIKYLGIIGSGVPALSLLLQTVRSGQEVVLRTEDDASLGTALTQIVQVLQAEVEGGTMSSIQFQKLLGAVRGTFTWTHFDKLEMIVDTTEGTLADKQEFFKEMEQRVPAYAFLVAAPLAFRVEELAAGLDRPTSLLGLRIIEPWNRGSLAEIVVPANVSATAVEGVRDWAASIEKCCIEVPDGPGGLAMRIWLPALNEAGLMLREGIAIERIDEAMRRFGMTYGPLEWMDRLGLDHIAALVAGCQALFAGRIAFETGFGLMVEKRWLGNQAEAGFYHRGLRGKKPHSGAELLFQARSQGEPARLAPFLSAADMQLWIQRRLVTLTVLEAVRCLEEGIVKDGDDLDCAMCLTGWATHRGGPIGYVRQLGYGPFAATCAELAHRHGPRFAPFVWLKDFLPAS